MSCYLRHTLDAVTSRVADEGDDDGLCLRQSRLGGGMFSTWPFVCPSVREHDFLKKNKPVCFCKLVQVNFGSQEVKDRGHVTSMLDLEAWRRAASFSTLRSSRFCGFSVPQATLRQRTRA